jgi:hypothetical protein
MQLAERNERNKYCGKEMEKGNQQREREKNEDGKKERNVINIRIKRGKIK